MTALIFFRRFHHFYTACSLWHWFYHPYHFLYLVYSASWAACEHVWSSSIRQPTAHWETTTWFMSTSRRRLALLNSSLSSPHTSSCLHTSTSPHVGPTLWVFSLLAFIPLVNESEWNNSGIKNLWNVPVVPLSWSPRLVLCGAGINIVQVHCSYIYTLSSPAEIYY